MPPGRYRLGTMEIIVSEDRATLPNGTLAGSIVTPAQALRNLIRFTGCDLPKAIDTVTRAPARVVRLQDPIGTGFGCCLYYCEGGSGVWMLG